MAVENRDLGTTQQRDAFNFSLGAVGVGVTATVLVVPYPSNLATAAVYAYGLSGAPTATFDVTRFNAAGVTTITGIVSTQTVFSATLVTGFTVSSGATLVPLQTGDLLTYRGLTANTAITTGNGMLVLQALQDIKTYFGK
jgi:hypothetical protein